MYTEKELLIIWFALIKEQQSREEGSTQWHKYQQIIAKTERFIKGRANLK